VCVCVYGSAMKNINQQVHSSLLTYVHNSQLYRFGYDLRVEQLSVYIC